VHHVGILYDQFMMHGQRNIKLSSTHTDSVTLACVVWTSLNQSSQYDGL